MKNIINKIITEKMPIIVLPIILIPTIIGIVIYYNNKLETYTNDMKQYVEKKVSYVDNIKNETQNMISNIHIEEKNEKENDSFNTIESVQKKSFKSDSPEIKTKVETVYVDRVQKEIVEVIKEDKNENINQSDNSEDNKEESNQENHEHSFVVKSKDDSTCIKNGKIVYECNECKYKYNDVLDLVDNNHKNLIYYSNITYCKDCEHVNSNPSYFLDGSKPIEYAERTEIEISRFSKLYTNTAYTYYINPENGITNFKASVKYEYSDGSVSEESQFTWSKGFGYAPYGNFTPSVPGKMKIILKLTSINNKETEEIIEKEINIIDPLVELKSNLEHEHNWDLENYYCTECQARYNINL